MWYQIKINAGLRLNTRGVYFKLDVTDLALFEANVYSGSGIKSRKYGNLYAQRTSDQICRARVTAVRSSPFTSTVIHTTVIVDILMI